MLNAQQLLAAFDDATPPQALTGTGIDDLDGLTGGVVAGAVWVITGAPGEGRSTLVTQFAVQLAQARHAVHLVTPREPAPRVAARLMANHSHVPMSSLWKATSACGPNDRVETGRARLARLPLALCPAGHVWAPEEVADDWTGHLLVDDADLVPGMSPARAGILAAAGHLVVVSLPRNHVLLGEGDNAPLQPAWGRVADVIVEVRHRCLAPQRPRPGEDPESAPVLRPGEADLVVHHHRWGPSRTCHALFEPQYARFGTLVGA